MSRRLLLLLLLALAPAWRAPAAAQVTNCVTILRMSREQAAAGSPVRLQGVLTCYIPNSQLCFVQDQSAGIYVFPAMWPRELRPGDEVEVEGETGPGRFSPIVRAAQLRPTGRRLALPERASSPAELNSGALDAQLIELRGVVQAQLDLSDATQIEVWSGNSPASVLVFAGPIAAMNLVDSRVAVRGVAGTMYRDGQLTGFGLFVNGIEDIEVFAPGIDPFSRPERAIAQPLQFAPDGSRDHRVKIKGTVVAHWPGEALFLQDETGAMMVQGQVAEKFEIGARVEASGFLRGTPGSWWLAHAVVRAVEGSAAIAVRESGDGPPAPGRTSVVAAEGRVLGNTASAERGLLTLDVRGTPLSVFAPDPFPELKVGSQVRLTGVWHQPPKAWQTVSGPGIWLHSAESFTITARPKLEVLRSSETSRAAWSAAALAAGAAATLGGFLIRRTSQLKEEAGKVRSARVSMAETEKELQRLHESRERLGRDLHDHIIQSIYAVGLSLDDSARQVREFPEQVEPRLRRALGEINSVIRELRNVILGLETNAIEPREFRTALKSLSLALGHEKSNRIRLEIDQAAMEALTPLQATELIHIAREGLSNSLRHGQAETTTFSLHRRDEKIRFAIEDDGLGFDPDSPGCCGFGLRNMAKRAENLGATFTIHARPGAGTRIVLDIPRQKQHFSQS